MGVLPSRNFSNTMADINPPLVNFDKESPRKWKQPNQLDANEKRFEPFDLFPAIASKYS
jgi:hypothetical protein